MKSLLSLWKMLAHECANGCHTSATMDCKTVHSRFKHEGLSFLTITLPTFGKDLQKGLDQGYVDRNLFQGFAWKGGLPRFLSGFLGRVFDRSSGVLLDDPCIESIRSIRQLTLMFGKMLLPCSPKRERTAFTEFIQCESDVRTSHEAISTEMWDRFERMAGMLFSSTFSEVDKRIYGLERVYPKHGPGATAERLTSNGKYRQTTWTRRLEEIFPSGEFLLPNWRFWRELQDVDIREPGAEIPVRVISVPKTLKTPRIIGIEPACMQYTQQAVAGVLLEELGKDNYLSSFLGFDDQVPNQDMAREGSITGTLATLDLSEASDRVSSQHVRHLLARFPYFRMATDASRSRKADVPGHGVVRLAKFASMGSALCFPMEAMVFLTIIFLGIQKSLNTSLSKKDLKVFLGSVRVYGDDIIVPVDHVNTVIGELEAFGFRVNSSKSFWTGRFRESCGKDYYAGDDISIVKVRRMFPTSRQHAAEVISLVSLRNQLYWSGYWKTTSWLDGRIRKVIHHFPNVLPTSPVLGRHSALGFQSSRMDTHLHSPIVRGYVECSRPPRDSLDGMGALLKCLLGSTRQSELSGPHNDRTSHLAAPVAEEHLERAGRPHAVDIKLRWSSPF